MKITGSYRHSDFATGEVYGVVLVDGTIVWEGPHTRSLATAIATASAAMRMVKETMSQFA